MDAIASRCTKLSSRPRCRMLFSKKNGPNDNGRKSTRAKVLFDSVADKKHFIRTAIDFNLKQCKFDFDLT